VECEGVREKLSEFLDRDLVDAICREIEQHIERCHDCRVEVDTVRKTITLYQKAGDVELPIRVSAELETVMAREYRRTRGGPRSD
jgi:predicted anti-sigma-YlaC factor YlaD